MPDKRTRIYDIREVIDTMVDIGFGARAAAGLRHSAWSPRSRASKAAPWA
ncbi:MAG: hypothetical protein QM749_09815 [Aquabacterium sp.]